MRVHIWRIAPRAQLVVRPNRNAQFLATDSRNRLSKFWAPTGGIDGEQDDSHSLLLRGGFLRQAHSGVFHLLPLGLRVQSKLEALIDKHMSSIGASKVSLSHISTEDLWKQTGRYSSNSELLRVTDRRESGFLLAPTHEEEITALVANMVHSYKDLPLRLYQTGRKYRDEKRPRQGLLRAKEFMMKDLYTFDTTHEAALQTYEEVRAAYTNLFNELKIPYLVADADSGNMGGKLSHEYHFVSPKGEDNVWSCDACSYVANEELVEQRPCLPAESETAVVEAKEEGNPLDFRGITLDRTTAISIVVPRPSSLSPSAPQPSWDTISSFVNLHAVKRIYPSLDTGIEPAALHTHLSSATAHKAIIHTSLKHTPPYNQVAAPEDVAVADIALVRPGAPCPRCETGHLDVQKAIEVGHTFHLGTRYSAPLNALVSVPPSTVPEPIHMGCHGIGVSRLLGSIASLLCDAQGLNWPRVVAPFEAIVLSAPRITPEDAAGVYDNLVASGIDAVLDDRENKNLAWKLRDADLIGYPVILVLGKAWKEHGGVEVQCRRLGVKKVVKEEDVRGQVEALLAQL
ncbi:prolyl-tRNA synthetase [Bimuria novae-zelandiae CBS 107.79]|uniref:proline--tRNA ligase n=1 Tax=Bimuria novae-zelandiae CBS 107.79 TaxID=1447943 RepID=A0A6A5UL94_9PLEO|nr:prolyl-tRNA synthetase [Bimuria novae-zelandiae CBS 107.79]